MGSSTRDHYFNLYGHLEVTKENLVNRLSTTPKIEKEEEEKTKSKSAVVKIADEDSDGEIVELRRTLTKHMKHNSVLRLHHDKNLVTPHTRDRLRRRSERWSFERRFAKISRSRRKPLLGHSPG